MKTKLLLLVLLGVTASSISLKAQDATLVRTTIDTVSIVETEGEGIIVLPKAYKHNWYIGVDGGVSLFHGENDRFGPLGNRFTPQFGLYIGKWHTPYVGFRFNLGGLESKGHVIEGGNNYEETAYGDPIHHSNGSTYYKQKWDYIHFRQDVMFNLSDILGGYKEDRFYSIIPYAGLGMMIATTFETNAEITGSFGINQRFRLSPAFDINLDLRGVMVHDRFDEVGTVHNIIFSGKSSATIGIAYNFNPRGWGRPKSTVKHIEKTEYYETEAEPKMLPLPAPIIMKEVVFSSAPIFFDLNSSEITNRSRVSISYIAKAMKEAPEDKVFTLVGHADKQTGNDRINDRLSKERAEAVYNILINEFGVDASRLKIEYKGGVDYMYYDDNTLSRVVIFED